MLTNIWRQTVTIPGQASATQEYRYDSVNRLTVAAENLPSANCGAGGGVWCQHYGYDTKGNRWVDQRYGDVNTGWDVSLFSGTNNRITAANWEYDDTGNVTKAGTGETFAYDAENRQVSICTQDPNGCPNAAGTGRTRYVYDGEGRRVQRLDADGVNQTVFVYDAFGNLAAEYATAGAPAAGTQYVTVDHLGSTRLVVGAGGTERHDYLPFGVEAVGGWRTSALGYVSGTVKQRFTGQERDSESTLDYFHARYFSGPQGRFTGVDPENAGAALGDPQSWNGYAYVSNNPLSNVDPTGLFGLSDIINFIGNIVGQNWGYSGGVPNIGGVNNGPWNEQLPIGGSFGGGLNTGTVFGSGSTGGGIFSLTPGQIAQVPSVGAQNLINFVYGWGGNFGLLIDLFTGSGNRRRTYNDSYFETADLKRSEGIQQVVGRITKACQAGITSGKIALGTGAAARNLPHDIMWSPTGVQVGGYAGGTWTATGNSVHIQIPNDAGAKSFFLHMTPNSPFSSGPFSTINQTFDFTIPNPCGPK